jgi:hypothetical protein
MQKNENQPPAPPPMRQEMARRAGAHEVLRAAEEFGDTMHIEDLAIEPTAPRFLSCTSAYWMRIAHRQAQPHFGDLA